MALLENRRLFLRALETEDLNVLYKWENDTEIWRYGSTLTPYSQFTLKHYITCSVSKDIYQSRQLRLMIIEKCFQQPIGTIDLYDFDPMHSRAAIGILIDKNYRKQGFGYEALQLTEEYAFQLLLLKQLYTYVPQSNIPCYRLIRKSGYQQTGLLKLWIKTFEGFTDVYLMQLINHNL